MQDPIGDVPLETRRLAAQHLENLRNSEMASDAAGLHLGDKVVPIYRPDIDEVAYWEFSILGTGDRSQALRSRGYPAGSPCGGGKDSGQGKAPVGFIIATNGRHDFPIAHWSLNRQPPSLQASQPFRDSCDKDPKDEKPAVAKRLYKLDSLCYVMEGDNGEPVGQTGQMPALIVGLPHNLARYAGQIASSVAAPRTRQPTDEGAEKAKYEIKRSKDKPPDLSLTAEGGWKAFKERYADSFGPLLEHLRNRAARTWELEDVIREFGEGIIAGETARVALLGEACVELSGEGAQHVRASMAEDGPPCLILSSERVSLPHEKDVNISITYANGDQEMLRYFVVSRGSPSNSKGERTSCWDEEA